jgi:hypothetical protein
LNREKEFLVTDPVKLSVVYYSATGTGAELARTLADEAEKAGAEVRLLPISRCSLAAEPAKPGPGKCRVGRSGPTG